MKKILFVAAESAPFIKTGGLGSVLGSLPKELDREKYKVSLVIPGYTCIGEQYRSQMKDLFSFPVHLGWRAQNVTVAYLEYQGIDCYFIKNDFYFIGDSPYLDLWIDIEKFCFFDKAVLEMLSYMELDIDIIHCHDWQTAMIPVYLKTFYFGDPFYRKIKTIFTIHNLKFQGITDIDRMKDITGLPDDAFTYDKLEFYNNANMMKGALIFSDKITTVSESYAEEITWQEYGEGLNQLLEYRRGDLIGIVNGIDYEMYNPQKDPYVKYPYSLKAFKKARKNNKKVLQEETGKTIDVNAFTMGIVSRLTDQKGYDLIDGVLDPFLDQGAQLYVIGAGEGWVEDIFYRYQDRYPNQVFFDKEYSDAVAKMIYAGCDVTLMPSKFEPCGLNQLMALRYGCVPIVRATGGLKDTVENYSEENKSGTGFAFDGYDKDSCYWAMHRAFELYQNDKKEWSNMMTRGMKKNYSWKNSAKSYEELYESI